MPHLLTLSHCSPLFKNKEKQTVLPLHSKTKTPWSPVCVSQLLLGLEPALECGGYTSGSLTEENKPFCSLQQSNANSSFTRDGTRCPLVSHSGFRLGRSMAITVSVHLSVLLCWKILFPCGPPLPPVTFTIFPLPLSHR